MNTLELKSGLHQIIDKISSPQKLQDIYEAISNYVADNQEDNWDSLSEAEQNAINKGIDELAEGKEISYEVIKNQNQQWFTK